MRVVSDKTGVVVCHFIEKSVVVVADESEIKELNDNLHKKTGSLSSPNNEKVIGCADKPARSNIKKTNFKRMLLR